MHKKVGKMVTFMPRQRDAEWLGWMVGKNAMKSSRI